MNEKPRSYRTLWLSLFGVITVSFLVLGYFGREIYHLKPPVPKRVVTTDGTVLFTGQSIRDGQNVWQSMGGQEVGTVWGHGAYVAPDWTADWLHRESVWLLNYWAEQTYRKTYAQLDPETQAALRERLKLEIRATPTTRKPAIWSCHPRGRKRLRRSARIMPPYLVTTRRFKSCARITRSPPTPSKRRNAVI